MPRDHIRCSHFLGMIKMFLSKHVKTVTEWWAVCWWFPWPQLCGFHQRLIQNSQLYSRWSASGWHLLGTFLAKRMCQVMLETKHISMWVGLLSHVTRLQCKCWEGCQNGVTHGFRVNHILESMNHLVYEMFKNVTNGHHSFLKCKVTFSDCSLQYVQ